MANVNSPTSAGRDSRVSAVIHGGFTHLADLVTAAAPMARDGNTSWTGDSGTYVWVR
jgi:hypothetical protein